MSENNHFLTETGSNPENSNRYEIIILNRNNGDVRILSESWPDEIIEALVD